MSYRALVVREALRAEAPAAAPPGAGAPQPVGGFRAAVEELERPGCGEGELLIRVSYSSLNYKDALSVSGNRGVTKHYPHVPGIDAAGVVEESRSSDFAAGDEVLVTGYDFGVSRPGGFAELATLPAAWALPLPRGLSAKGAMEYGTAGLTAAFAVVRLRSAGIAPEGGPLLVTGATGGVGGFALAILAKLGYTVHASTGKSAARAYLEGLGAQSVIGRSELTQEHPNALLHSRWSGGVDTVGGEGLATLVKSTSYGGAVATCGNAASGDLSLSVYPFILRGISLLGIESAAAAKSAREEAWALLAGPWNVLDRGIVFSECGLSEIGDYVRRMLSGEVTGRVVVDPKR